MKRDDCPKIVSPHADVTALLSDDTKSLLLKESYEVVAGEDRKLNH
jgi:hypothetical protein